MLPGVITIVLILVLAFVFMLPKVPLDIIQDWLPLYKSLIEISAIILGGIWTYLLFVKNRVDYPYIKAQHRIFFTPVLDNRIFLSVFIILENAGKVAINLKEGKVYVRQIRPLPDDMAELVQRADAVALREGKVDSLFVDDGRQLAWREIGYRECSWEKGEIKIEPGESEEIQFDFIIDRDVEVIEILSYFEDDRKKNKRSVGWKLTSLVNLKEMKNE